MSQYVGTSIPSIASEGSANSTSIEDGAVETIKATVLDYTNANPIAVRLSDTNGDYVSAGAGTQYTEDVAAAANPIGTALMLVRTDTLLTSTVSADGDNIAARGTAKGEQYVKLTDDIHARPPDAIQARQFTVGSVAVQIDSPVLSSPGKRRAVGIQTRGQNWAAYAYSSGVTFHGNSMFLPPNSFHAVRPPTATSLWAITEQTSAPTLTVQSINGASAAGTATDPSNALTSDDTRAVINANNETIRVDGITYIPTASTVIQSVRIGCEARKSSAISVAAHQYSDGAFAISGSGEIAVNAGGRVLVLLGVFRSDVTKTVSSVVGLGLTWTQLVANLATSDSQGLDVWYAYGDFAAGDVTVTLSGSVFRMVLGVEVVANVAATSTIQASGTTTGTGATVTGPSVAGTANGFAVLFAGFNTSNGGTAGAGYTERQDFRLSNSGESNLSIETKPLTVTGAEVGTYTIAGGGSANWGSVGVTIRPSTGSNPTITLSSETPSWTVGAGSGDITFTSTTDSTQFVDISHDRLWIESNIDNLVLVATGKAINGNTAEVDRLFAEITDTSGRVQRLSVTQLAGASS